VELSSRPLRPLRILHLIAHSEPGGLSRYVHDLAAAMHERGHDVRVAGNRGGWQELFDRARFPYVQAPLDRGPIELWRASRALRDHLRGHPVDVIHAHYRRTTFVGRLLQRDRRPPLLYTVHLSDMPLNWAARLMNDYGDHVHVPAAEAGRWAVERAGVDPARVTLIPHGVHVECFPVADPETRRLARRQFSLREEDRVAAYVGRLDYPKNEEWLLDVVERGRARIPNLKLLVAGSGPHEAAFRRQIVARDLANHVIALGERLDPLTVYQAADALLLPSQREGFSLSTAEAMSVGIPVCRTRTAGAAELILENVTGRATPIDREAFVSAAIEFLRDGDALRTMAAAAARHVRKHFTFDRQLSETIALYYRIAGLAEPSNSPAPAPAEAVRP